MIPVQIYLNEVTNARIDKCPNCFFLPNYLYPKQHNVGFICNELSTVTMETQPNGSKLEYILKWIRAYVRERSSV